MGLPAYGYLYYMTYKNRTEYQRKLDDPMNHDTTRGNAFFGLNWGATADTIIEESLDTGDLLFFKYDSNSL